MAGWREIDLPLAIAAAAAIAVAVHATPLILRGKPLLSLKCVPALGAMVMVMAAIAGWLAGSAAKPQPLDLPPINGQTIIARIDAIEHKNFSTQLEATILSCPQNRAALPHKAQMSISIKANDYLLQEGELLSFKALLEPIASLGNPDEFDYARYMRNKGIIYTQTLEPDSYDTIGYNDNTDQAGTNGSCGACYLPICVTTLENLQNGTVRYYNNKGGVPSGWQAIYVYAEK